MIKKKKTVSSRPIPVYVLLATLAVAMAAGFFLDRGGKSIPRTPLMAGYSAGQIGTVAGTGSPGYSGDGMPANKSQINWPYGIYVDRKGSLYFADYNNHRIRKVDPLTGLIYTVAGTGEQGFSGDGGPATQARLNLPDGVEVDSRGNIYFQDAGNQRIRRVDARTGIITTIAGTGEAGFSGDGGKAVEAAMYYPGLGTVDADDNVIFADLYNDRIRKVDVGTGIITTLVGTGITQYNGDGIPATSANIDDPGGTFFDRAGNLLVCDRGNLRIRKVDRRTGIISTVAGSGVSGDSGEGGPALKAQFINPYGIWLDREDNLYIAGWYTHKVHRVDSSSGIITTVAGTGVKGFNADGVSATEAQLINPVSVAVDGSGNLYIAELDGGRIRCIAAPVAGSSPALKAVLPPGEK